MKNNKILSITLPQSKVTKKAAPKKRVSGVKTGIGGLTVLDNLMLNSLKETAKKTETAKLKNALIELKNSRSKLEKTASKRDNEFNSKQISIIENELAKKSKGISGSLFQKFQDVAKETNFTLRGAKLGTFLKWMNRNSKEIFGRSITTLKWFTVLDKYPQVMDAMASARIDTEPLEDEDEDEVEKYYAKAKK